MLRKFAETATPVVTISKDGDRWTIKTVTTLKTTVITFKIGEIFMEKRLDGQEVRSMVYLDGDKMTQKQFADAAKDLKEVNITRWVEGDKMMVKAVVSDVSCLRTYTKCSTGH